MSLPLEDVRVVDVTQYVAGPLCGSLLHELGADVVKVEKPSGDRLRASLGFEVLSARDNMDYAGLAAVMLLIGLLGFAMDSLMQLGFKRWADATA